MDCVNLIVCYWFGFAYLLEIHTKVFMDEKLPLQFISGKKKMMHVGGRERMQTDQE